MHLVDEQHRQHLRRSGTAPIRKVIVRVTIGSFSLAALLGIIALLRGGEFGQTQFRVLLTTLLVGVVSIAVLCYLATAGRPSQPVGVAGGVVVLVPLVTALLMIWGDVENGPSEAVLKTFGIGTAVAATLAQASLLLTLGERGRPGGAPHPPRHARLRRRPRCHGQRTHRGVRPRPRAATTTASSASWPSSTCWAPWSWRPS